MPHPTISDANIDFTRNADSFFTHIFARSVSIHITPLLANTQITPMQVTILGLALGLAGAVIGSIPSLYSGIFAALLIESAHVLDCVDGELARLTGRGNPFAAAMDPITDRIKDSAIMISSYLQTFQDPPFALNTIAIGAIALGSLGFWLCYMYIVDAFVNPSRREDQSDFKQKKLYMGLYDLFIYGCIVFLLAGYFTFFLFYVMILAVTGISIQILRLKKLLTPNQVKLSND